MKIHYEITRECCQTRDLRDYKGLQIEDLSRFFRYCKWCGQIWSYQKPQMGALEGFYRKVFCSGIEATYESGLTPTSHES